MSWAAVSRTLRRTLTLSLLGISGVLIWAVPALGATINVNTVTDELSADGHCSLREAITAANTNAAPFAGSGECVAGSGVDTVALPAGSFLLTKAGPGEDANKTGDLDILDTAATTLVGSGAGASTIDANGIDRALHVLAGRIATIQAVTITGGRTLTGTVGFEAIGEKGSGTGAGATAVGGTGNAGESGGGILNAGSLTIIDSAITHNATGGGGKGGAAYGGEGGSAGGAGGIGFGGKGGNGGSGGGAFNTGVLSLIRTTVTGNLTGPGGNGATAVGGDGGPGRTAGIGDAGHGGEGGYGGGVAESGGAALTIDQSSISANATGVGGEGGFGFGGSGGKGTGSGGGASGGDGDGGFGGYGGFGGGVNLASPGDSMQVTNSLINANTTGAGGTGGNGIGGTGGTGGTGATGGTGGPGSGGFGGSGGYGGGAETTLPETTVSATNVTVTANVTGPGGAAGGGVGGIGGSGGTGGGSGGKGGGGSGSVGGTNGPGGAFAMGGSFGLVSSTVTSNAVGAPGAAGPGEGGSGGAGNGGGAGGEAGASNPGTAGTPNPGAITSFFSATTTLKSTIVAGNAPPNCSGTITDGSNDISFPDATCLGANVDPKLAALADNGGPTRTQALNPGSPALDAVPAGGAGCPATDQRGVSRPQGPACDAGAFELFVAVLGGGPTGGGTTLGGTTLGGTKGVGPGPPPPVVSGETISPSAFRAAPSGASALAAKGRYGAKVSYTLNERAIVRFTAVQSQPGRRGRGGRCVKPTSANRRAHRCTQLVSLRGSFTRVAGTGANRFRFTGRIGGRTLKPGRYRLLATPSVGSVVGRAASAAFRIIK
jgi:CSLREA domain-containing protein